MFVTKENGTSLKIVCTSPSTAEIYVDGNKISGVTSVNVSLCVDSFSAEAFANNATMEFNLSGAEIIPFVGAVSEMS